MGAFDYRQAQEVRDAFARHGVRYLFIGKSGAILLGFPDTLAVVRGILEGAYRLACMKLGQAASEIALIPIFRHIQIRAR